MPEEVEDCKEAVLRDNPDYDESRAYAVCYAQQKGYDDPEAVAAVALKQKTGEWPGVHPSETTSAGRDHLLDRYAAKAREVTKQMVADRTLTFKADLSAGGHHVLYKDDERMVIWGPASVEVVDKEGDKITAKALERALPQLLRRQRLSREHSDQIVGKILEGFETDDPVTVKIEGKTFTRTDFPTAVLELDGMDPALYVAGEIWEDTRQGRQTRKEIENGTIDSYSISGEAITSTTKVKDGEAFDEITDLDLSAVTLCERGMNQEAKFGVVQKEGYDPSEASVPATVLLGKSSNMTETETEKDEPEADEADGESDDTTLKDLPLDELREEFKSAAQEVLENADYVTAGELEEFKAGDDVNATYGGAGDEEDDEASESDEEEEQKNVESPEAQEALQVLADQYPGLDVDELADLVRNAAEGSDEDEEIVAEEDDDEEDMEPPAEDDLDVEDMGDDEEDEEEEEVERAGYSEDELESLLPDDLYAAVREYLVPEEEPEVGDDVDEIEASEDEEAEKDEEASDEEADAEDFGKFDDIPGEDPIEKTVNRTVSSGFSTLPGPTPDDDETVEKGVAPSHAATEVDDEEGSMTPALAMVYKDDPVMQEINQEE